MIPGSEPDATISKQSHELTPEELEAQLERDDLQLFVEQHGPKVVKESSRQVSKITTDCRVLRGQSQPLSTYSWLPEELVEQILVARRSDTYLNTNQTPKNLSEDDWAHRFWSLQKTLTKIGVPKERVLELLRSPNLLLVESITDAEYIWGLREALDLLALEHPTDLPPFDYATAKNHFLDEDDQQLPKSPPKPRSQPPSSRATPINSGVTTPQIIIAEDEIEVSDIDSDADPDLLVDTYLSTKSRLFKINPFLVDDGNSKRKKTPNPLAISTSTGVRKLQDKLRRIESDALFDIDLARMKWATERINLARESPAPKRPKKNVLNQMSRELLDEQHSTSTASSRPSSDTDDTELLGDMFAIPDQVIHTQNSQNGTDSVVLKDFGKVTGYNPRRLLEDVIRSRDSTAKVSFRIISPTQYACRHCVTISWSKSQEKAMDGTPDPAILLEQESSSRDRNRLARISLSMINIAAVDSQQSEAYVATAALFCLFPEEKSYLKLGQAWRDLWLDFVKARTEKIDALDREDVKVLRKIAGERLENARHEDIILTSDLRNQAQLSSPHSGNGKSSHLIEIRNHLAMIAQDLWLQRTRSPQYHYMLQFRMALPMFSFRDYALSTIHSNSVIILCGETGCGKSTQLPAYILEEQLSLGNYCKVLCTEPRRISAISLAQRVSEELGELPGEVGGPASLIGYAVRLDSKLSAQTRLTFATVGVVLRMLESTSGLDDYTHLVIDEVHERSIETDFLLIVLRTLLIKRPELKVILMSATVDASKFSSYLNNAPIIDVPGRTFPVNTLFLEDAIELTHYAGGKHDIQQQDEEDIDNEPSGTSGDLQSYSPSTRTTLAEYDEYQMDYRLILSLMEAVITRQELVPYSKAILVFLPGIGEIRELNNLILSHPAFGNNCLIYPLHSTISSEEQQQAFVVPPVGTIKIVLSTNIAETGVTIPDVTCVIDTGRHKEMRYDERRQLSRLVTSFISRANAKQRRGRAGRVQEGICFHLFTKKRHDEMMTASQTPEMLRLSLQDLIMKVKNCGLGAAEHALASALDPPAPKNIRRAIDSLIDVGALCTDEELTPLGHQLVTLGLDANLGKLCIYSAIFGCLDAGLTIAAILSSKSPFLTPFGARVEANQARLAFSRGDSDLLTAYNAYCSWRRVSETHHENVFAFCRKHFLSPQVLSNIEELKAQLFNSLCETSLVKPSQSGYLKGRGHGYVLASPLNHFTDELSNLAMARNSCTLKANWMRTV